MSSKSVFDNKDFQIDLVNGIAIVKINFTRPTINEVKELKLVFETLIAVKHYKIVIDFSHCNFTDSIIIGIIVIAIKEVRKKKGDIFVVTSPGKMRILFAQKGLDKVIRQFHTIEKAVASFSLN